MSEQRIYFQNLQTLSKKHLEALREQYRENPLSLLDMTAGEAQRVVDRIAEFYADHLEQSGLAGYVVGMSGGLDSTLVAYLTVGAAGAEKVYGVCLPTLMTPQGDIDDTLDVMKTLGVDHNNYQKFRDNVETLIALFEEMGVKATDKELERIKRGNIQARIRMVVMRDIARAKNYLVAGTSNASERLLGYATLAGDGLGGIDNEGIDQLFKTTARKLGTFLELPATVMAKDPSARLWHGQTDEGELGMSYENIDQILVGHLLQIPPEEIVTVIRRDAVTLTKVIELLGRVRNNRHKGEMPRVALLNS